MGLEVAAVAITDAFAIFAAAATYTPAGGSPTTVQAIPFVHDPPLDLGDLRGYAPGWRVLLLVSEVPIKPAQQSTVVIGADTYRLRSDAHEGPLGNVWLCDTVRE